MALQVQSGVLIAACVTGDFAPLQNLAADVNRYDERGNSLLGRFVATEPFTDRHAATLPRLITELGANVDLVHRQTGKTALHAAASFGNAIAVSILLDNGAAVDARDNAGATPLINCASFAGNSRVIELLLSRGASIDAITRSSYTALHFAVDQDQIENARVLLVHGANRDIRNEDRRRPLDGATSQRNGLPSQAMKDLFRRTVGELMQDTERERIEIFLTRTNPLDEPLRDRDLVSARLLINHPRFTPGHLENGFRFAFSSGLINNYDLLFDLFRERVSLLPLVESVLQDKAAELASLRREIESAHRERERLSQPDRRNADDFDVGRGNAGDRSAAIMDYQRYLQFKDYNEAIRVRDLKGQDARIRSLSNNVTRTEGQIAVLRRLQDHFNPGTALVAGIQALDINRG